MQQTIDLMIHTTKTHGLHEMNEVPETAAELCNVGIRNHHYLSVVFRVV
jgi:hypothetical protein